MINGKKKHEKNFDQRIVKKIQYMRTNWTIEMGGFYGNKRYTYKDL